MSAILEADVALLHIAGGGTRVTPPPGVLAQTPPRRTARGRGDDLVFLALDLSPGHASPSGLRDRLAQVAVDVFYGTPGSVTSALREAAAAINDHLIDFNQEPGAEVILQGRLLMGVLRDDDLYLLQAGAGQAMLIRPNRVTRYTSEETVERPLGSTLSPFVRFHHIQVNQNDALIATVSEPPYWSDATLSGLATLAPAQAADRLAAARNTDLTGLFIRFTQTGEAPELPAAPKPAPDIEISTPQARTAAPSRRSSMAHRREGRFASTSRFFNHLAQGLSRFITPISQAASRLITRMAPGLAEPPQPGMFSRSVLIGTAVAVPLLIVTIAMVVYYRVGRADQFRTYLEQAQTAIAQAQEAESLEAARPDWEEAQGWILLAEEYGHTDESTQLHQLIQERLDVLDMVVRLEFTPIVSGGFGAEANITALAASSTDLYIYDDQAQRIWHAWGAPERGYELDSTFQCLNGPDSYTDVGPLVDIVIQPAPGALGVEGVVGIDSDGTLLYCAPDKQPALAQLTPPDVGWGRIQALDSFENQLYILDTVRDSVWIYAAPGGLFTGTPAYFFTEEVRDLAGAIDLAMLQDELVILYTSGEIDRCSRFVDETTTGDERIRVECDEEPRFQDDRPGYEATAQIPGALPVAVTFSPPPEPALFFLDSMINRIYHYSSRLIYQGQYLSQEELEGEISALTIGPPKDIFIAIGSQVYYARP
jgi:hypothetical protein